VSSYLGADELLAELVDAARVMGVSVYADDGGTSNCAGLYPPRVERLRSDPETIFALEPDLVLVAGFTDSDALRLIDASGLPVARWSRFDSFADILGQITLVGAAVGEEGRAKALAAAVARQLAEVEGRLRNERRRRVLYFDPPSFTMGKGTLVDEILSLAGGVNVVRELGISGPSEIDLETILALDPEVVFLPSYAGNGSALRTLAGLPIWREVPAVRAGRAHEVPGAWIATVSHHAARGLARVARLLHPEAFGGLGANQTK
jgi:iron complex transport system substrate-binding protein